MFQWCITLVCPMRPVSGTSGPRQADGCQDRIYVWTEHESPVDAYDEALRVLEGWPQGSRPVDVTPVGMYVPAGGPGGCVPGDLALEEVRGIPA